MSSVRLDVRAFFEYYERAAEDPDGGALSSCLCDVFMSLDPNSASALSRQALLAALPCRRALFQAIGSDGLELAAITETPLDDAHTLVQTSWKLRMGNESPRDDITLLSTFVLRKQKGAWRIALYLNHQDIPKLFGDLAARA